MTSMDYAAIIVILNNSVSIILEDPSKSPAGPRKVDP